jgi:hypothetical protein
MTELRRLLGVYHAEGTLSGELRYWIGARLGRAHCALCDITHGTFREKRTWQACRTTLPVPFETFHLDDQPAALAAVTAAATPCVVAETDDGFEVLLGPADLNACAGDPEALVGHLTEELADRDLVPGG